MLQTQCPQRAHPGLLALALAAANWALGAAGHLTWPWPSTLALMLLAASAEQPARLEPLLTAPSMGGAAAAAQIRSFCLLYSRGRDAGSCPGSAAAEHLCVFCIVLSSACPAASGLGLHLSKGPHQLHHAQYYTSKNILSPTPYQESRIGSTVPTAPTL